MRSSFTVHTGLKLVRTPNYRHQAMLRRWMAMGVIAALLIGGGLVLTQTPHGVFNPSSTDQESVP